MNTCTTFVDQHASRYHPSPDIFDLEQFDGREYQYVCSGALANVRAVFESMAGKVRRIVRPGKHKPRPSYRTPLGYRGHALDKGATVAAYIAWAQAKGLRRIHAYKSTWFRDIQDFRIAGGEVEYVEVSDFLGPVTDTHTGEFHAE